MFVRSTDRATEPRKMRFVGDLGGSVIMGYESSATSAERIPEIRLLQATETFETGDQSWNASKEATTSP
jgi:hypothetical protein